jgi:peptidoglycan/LPS O-acetylase OafA/YrhL
MTMAPGQPGSVVARDDLAIAQPAEGVSRPAHRLAGLDALRGIAVLLVVGAHFNLGKAARVSPAWLDASLRQWQGFGWIGVDLFFVLSGFLISGLLFREYSTQGRVRVGRFLVRRGLKIYPSFWAMLLYTVAAALATGHAVSLATLGSELLFIQNYGPTMYNFTWTLAVEEHFYLLLAALVAWRVHRDGHPHRVFPIVVAALPVVLLLRCYWVWQWPVEHVSHIRPTHLRLDGLAFGVALGYLAVFHGPALEAWIRRWRWVLLGGGAGLAVISLAWPVTNNLAYTAGRSALYLAAGAFLLLARYAPFGAPRRSIVIPLAWIGANSYAIYLWHVTVRNWGGGLLAMSTGQTAPTVPGLVLYVVAAVLFGAFMTRMIERPALAWRDRHFP